MKNEASRITFRFWKFRGKRSRNHDAILDGVSRSWTAPLRIDHPKRSIVPAHLVLVERHTNARKPRPAVRSPRRATGSPDAFQTKRIRRKNSGPQQFFRAVDIGQNAVAQLGPLLDGIWPEDRHSAMGIISGIGSSSHGRSRSFDAP